MPVYNLHLHLEGAHPPSALFEAASTLIPPIFSSEEEVTKRCVVSRDEMLGLATDDERRTRFAGAMEQTRRVYTSEHTVQTLVERTCIAASLQAPDGFELRFSLYSMVRSFIKATRIAAMELVPVQDVEVLGRALLKAVIAGAKASGKPVRLRFGLSRNVPAPQDGILLRQYIAVARLALEAPFTRALCGLDVLGFASKGYAEPYPAPMVELIEALRESLTDLVVHAGEVYMGDVVAPVASVREALKLRPKAIGHGIWAATDQALMEECAMRDVVFEVCPMSNQILNKDGLLRLRSLCGGRPPLTVLHEHGLKCVISSDDPATFGTSLNEDRSYATSLGLALVEFDRVAESRWQALPVPTF